MAGIFILEGNNMACSNSFDMDFSKGKKIVVKNVFTKSAPRLNEEVVCLVKFDMGKPMTFKGYISDIRGGNTYVIKQTSSIDSDGAATILSKIATLI